ncbi:MAG TPA: hypothetical protein VHA75_20665 [Rugosimonospora sp.]|nr:hypothetical protein [Rugosimonospora sp.]
MTDSTGPAEIPEIPGGAITISTTAPDVETRVVLFRIGDQEYTVPKKLPGPALLRMMELNVTSGGGAAMLYALSTGLGEDGYAALHDAGGMDEDNLAAILTRIEDLYLPQAERLGKAAKRR